MLLVSSSPASSSCPHPVLAVLLSVLRVPDPDDDVAGAEVEVWVVGDVVDANVLLCAQNLDGEGDKEQS